MKHTSAESTIWGYEVREAAHVGGWLDLGGLGAQNNIHDKKIFPRYSRGIPAGIRCKKCVGSIDMMIYYCQGTGCSLSSQYSLQERIFAPPGATFLRTGRPTIVNFLAVPGFYRFG